MPYMSGLLLYSNTWVEEALRDALRLLHLQGAWLDSGWVSIFDHKQPFETVNFGEYMAGKPELHNKWANHGQVPFVSAEVSHVWNCHIYRTLDLEAGLGHGADPERWEKGVAG
eukprot:2497419-Heterocapsa_arctica.AAC.1